MITLRYDIDSKERQNCSPIAVLGGSLDGEPKPILSIEKIPLGMGLLPLLHMPNFFTGRIGEGFG